MSKAEKPDKKYELIERKNEIVPYTGDMLYMSSRHIPWLAGGMVLLVGAMFVAGYFWGQRNILVTMHEQQGSDENALYMSTHAPVQSWRAEIIGFGTMQAAQDLAYKLQDAGLPVHVVERQSHSARGKKVVWYQVVTEPFTYKKELLAWVDKIEQQEQVHDIRIARV